MNKKYTIGQLRQVKGIGEKTIQRIIKQFDESEYISKYNPSIHIEPNSLVNGDMLEVMNGIPDKSVDMILTDLPYGTTACSWDTVIPYDKLWKQYNRVIKDNGAIVLFGSEPFSTHLRMSNIDNYKYDWIWRKSKGGGFALANVMPLKRHENITVFYKNTPVYNPVKTMAKEHEIDKRININNPVKPEGSTQNIKNIIRKKDDGTRFPVSVIDFKSHWSKGMHPTQKPVELLEYLIKTYTNECEVVLDSTMGSGSTCVASKNLNRKYIGIELDKKYFEIAKRRVEGE